MNIIIGASGQVGSVLIREILDKDLPARAVVRNPDKIVDKNIETRVADAFNAEQLIEAFTGGTSVFLLTPENPASTDIIRDTQTIVENYRTAIKETGIKRVVALSCVGAHIEGKTGNILMSRILEQGLDDLDIEKVIIRPSYYFNNWMGYLETIEQYQVLPTFFPESFELDMHSPVDLAKFIATVMTKPQTTGNKEVYELTGPRKYSSLDVAQVFSKILNKEITAQSIPPKQWMETLLSVGFTFNTASNLADMTQAVIDGTIVPEWPDNTMMLPTSLEKYIEDQLKG